MLKPLPDDVCETLQKIAYLLTRLATQHKGEVFETHLHQYASVIDMVRVHQAIERAQRATAYCRGYLWVLYPSMN